MASKLPDDKEAELIQAFNLYCIFNPETGHFDKNNTSKVSTKLLRNVRVYVRHPPDKTLIY